MASFTNNDVDTGISYEASTNAVRKLLDKVKARKQLLIRDYNRVHGLSAMLDELIEFEYPKGVLQSVWRKLKKPSVKTMSKLRKGEGSVKREYDRLTPHVEDIAEQLKRFKFSKALDDLIQFQGDPRPRNNLGMFTDPGEGGPDPNAMVKTYRIAPAQPGMSPNKEGHSLLGLGGLAVAGGAAGGFGGAIGGVAGKAALEKISGAISRFRKKK